LWIERELTIIIFSFINSNHLNIYTYSINNYNSLTLYIIFGRKIINCTYNSLKYIDLQYGILRLIRILCPWWFHRKIGSQTSIYKRWMMKRKITFIIAKKSLISNSKKSNLRTSYLYSSPKLICLHAIKYFKRVSMVIFN